MNNISSLSSDTGLNVLPIAALVAVGVVLGMMLFVGVFVIVVVANRAEPDPSGQRPAAVYEFGVSFLSVFIALFASFGVVAGLVQLIGSHPGVSSGSQHPIGDAVARIVVLTGLILLVSVTLLRVHLTRALRLQDWQDGGPGPVTRVAHSYAAAVSFVAVLIGSTSLVLFVYQVFRILGPGVFELSGSKVAAARLLLDALYLTLGSMVILAWHMRLLPGGPLFRPVLPGSRNGGGTSDHGGPSRPAGGDVLGGPPLLTSSTPTGAPSPGVPTSPTSPMASTAPSASIVGLPEPPPPAPFRLPPRPLTPVATLPPPPSAFATPPPGFPPPSAWS